MHNQEVKITYQKYKKMKFCFSYLFWKKIIIGSILIILFGLFAITGEDPASIEEMLAFDIFCILCIILLFKLGDRLFLKFRYQKKLQKYPYQFQYELYFYEDYMEIKSDIVTRKIYPRDVWKIKNTIDEIYILLHDKTILPIPPSEEFIEYINIWMQKENAKTKVDIQQYMNPTSIPYKKTRIFLICWFVITILSIWGGLFLVMLIHSFTNEPTALTLRYYWCFLLCLPIPISSIILGIVYKRKGIRCTKNVVGGIIVSVFMLIIGLIGLQTDFEKDYKESSFYETILSETLPSKGKFFQIKWDESYLLDHISNYIKIHEKLDANIFLNNIKHNQNWLAQSKVSNSLKQFIPISLYCPSKDCYYSLYILELDAYNEIPMRTDKYHMYVMMYNPDNQYISIEQFAYWYQA